MKNNYYTYAYLREDKTPYYVGKGRGNRAYDKRRRIKPPKDKSRILLLKKNLTEAEAFKHEVYMIFVLGRKDLGTGILHNLTNGGEGVSGRVKSKTERQAISERMSGENHPLFGVPRTEAQKKAHSERMSGENNPNFGVSHTKEWKKAQSEKVSGEKAPHYGKFGALHHNSKAIIAIEPDGTQRHFGGVREAARKLKIDQGHLSKYARSGNVLTKGPFKNWQFVYENP